MLNGVGLDTFKEYFLVPERRGPWQFDSFRQTKPLTSYTSLGAHLFVFLLEVSTKAIGAAILFHRPLTAFAAKQRKRTLLA